MEQKNNQQQGSDNKVAQELTPMKRFNKAIASVEMQQYLDSVLGEKRSSFVNNIVSLVSNTAALQDCAPMSVVYAGLKATALDLPLDPNLGFAYVIPYNLKDEGKLAQFQLGYKGFVQLAIRSRQFETINVTELHEGEVGARNIVTGAIELHAVPDRDKKPVVGYVAYFKLNSGFETMLFMTKDEVNAHARRYSKTYASDRTRNASKWTTDFDAMAKKTVLKLLLSRWAPLSVELKDAVTSDQVVFTDNGTERFYDNPEDQMQSPAESAENRKEEMREKIASGQAEQPKLL